jgi:hypothetical protein
VDGFAAGSAAGFGEFVAQVDEAVAGEGERLVMESGANGVEDFVRLLLAARLRPYVQREDVLGAGVGFGIGTGGPVALGGVAKVRYGSAVPWGTSSKMRSAPMSVVSAASAESVAKMDCCRAKAAEGMGYSLRSLSSRNSASAE